MGWLTPIRAIFLWLDTVAFSLLDNVYDLFVIVGKNELISMDAVESLINNIYVLISIVAFFRLAILLINSIINPDKLFEKGKGFGNIVARIFLMLVLLVMLPTIYNILSEVQSTILDNNVIQKAIIGNSNFGGDVEGEGDAISDAGKTMQKIAITALIRPENDFFVNGAEGVDAYLNGGDSSNIDTYVNDDCGRNCKRAMKKYYNVANDNSGSFRISALSGWIGGSAEVEAEDGETEDVYYYQYVAILTTITAVFITYVFLSFCIDIAVRSVELAVLQMLSPLFIATIIDPKSTSSGGIFNNYLKRYGKTYADIFIKLAIICLAILLISLVQDSELYRLGGGNPLLRLFILYAILIFAKRAPKLISSLLNLKGDDIGLKGLSIKNKLGEAAIVGGAVKRGMEKAENTVKGAAKGAAGMGLGGFMGGKGLKGRLEGAMKGTITGTFSGGEAGRRGDKGIFGDSFRKGNEYARGGRESIFTKMGNKAKGLSQAIQEKGFGGGLIDSNMSEIKGMEKRLANMYGTANAGKIMASLGRDGVNFNDYKSVDTYKKELKQYTDATGPIGGYKPEDMYLKQNILKEREKLLKSLDELGNRYSQAMQSGDTALANAIQKNMIDKFDKAKNGKILDESSNLGIDKISDNINDVKADIQGLYAKNSKALESINSSISQIENPPKLNSGDSGK